MRPTSLLGEQMWLLAHLIHTKWSNKNMTQTLNLYKKHIFCPNETVKPTTLVLFSLLLCFYLPFSFSYFDHSGHIELVWRFHLWADYRLVGPTIAPLFWALLLLPLLLGSHPHLAHDHLQTNQHTVLERGCRCRITSGPAVPVQELPWKNAFVGGGFIHTYTHTVSFSRNSIKLLNTLLLFLAGSVKMRILVQFCLSLSLLHLRGTR